MPDLVHACQNYFEKRICNRRTLCPARTHRDSLSTTSLLRRTLSSMRVIVTSSSDGLGRHLRKRNTQCRRRYTYLPARFVLARGHGRQFRVDADDPFERAFGRRLHHLRVYLGDHPAQKDTQYKRVDTLTYTAYLVFPSAHSTHPSSGPKVSVGVRISSIFRPSRRSDSLSEL